MNLIYLHGFQSHANSVKGTLLKQYCQKNMPQISVHLPDLNLAPNEAIAQLHQYIQPLKNLAFVGSSLGGFYATYLARYYHAPAVLINPTIEPWLLFLSLFGEAQLPYNVTSTWQLQQEHLQQLQKLAQTFDGQWEQFLVLLQCQDEVLDYTQAQRYYGQAKQPAMVITEQKGDHVMQNFAEKIPMLLTFLSHQIVLKETI